MAGASEHPVARRLRKAVNIVVIPLLLTFGAIAVAKILDILA